ncbi:MAG: flagellar hook-length control protein FliK [Kangiellaceae bacterium]|nr:flagellar hook-length control protein FliK [Kangiellaceae bacterium]
MQITPNDVSTNSDITRNIDIKVARLIRDFVDKTLILEQLNISQNQGLLLKLSLGSQNLTLQLPLTSNEILKLLSQNSNSGAEKSTFQVAITANQQIRITIKSNSTINNYRPVTEIVFEQSKLSSDKILILAQQKVVSTNNSSEIAASRPSLPVTPSSNLPDASKPNKPGNLKNQSSLLSPASPENRQTTSANSIRSTVTLQSTSNSPIKATNVSITNPIYSGNKVAPVIKEFLRHSFTKHIPLNQHIAKLSEGFSHLNQLTNTLAHTMSTGTKLTTQTVASNLRPLFQEVNLLNQSFTSLIQSIKENNIKTPSGLAQAVKSSGNLFEAKLAQTSIFRDSSGINSLSSRRSEEAISSTNTKSQNKGLSAEATRRETGTSTPVIKNDLKLLLVQIKSRLEGLISQLSSTTNSTSSALDRTTSSLGQGQHTPTTAGQANSQSPTGTSSHSYERTRVEQELNQLSTSRLTEKPRDNFSRVAQINLPIVQQNLLIRQASEMLTEVRNSIAQIESNQLLSLRTEQPNLHQFLVDLPFANGAEIDSFELLFEHLKDPKQSSAKKQWKVIVRFDLEPLGPMFAQVELKDDKISTHIFAESQQTAKLINENIHVLKKSLIDAGVKTEEVKSSQGHIPDKLIKNNEHSVDFHA